jgi:hypothetical protein
MVREPAGDAALSCPRCLRRGIAVPLLNAVPKQNPVAEPREPVGLR